MEENTYVINIEDSAGYVIRATSEEAAIDLAMEYFNEREPEVSVEIDNDLEPDITID